MVNAKESWDDIKDLQEERSESKKKIVEMGTSLDGMTKALKKLEEVKQEVEGKSNGGDGW